MIWVRRRWMRGAVAVPAMLLTSVLGIAAPLLERADVRTTPIVESEHDPGSCPAPHDHRLCTQASANHSVPSERSYSADLGHTLRTAPPPTVARIVAAATIRLAPARAPPSS